MYSSARESELPTIEVIPPPPSCTNPDFILVPPKIQPPTTASVSPKNVLIIDGIPYNPKVNPEYVNIHQILETVDAKAKSNIDLYNSVESGISQSNLGAGGDME